MTIKHVTPSTFLIFDKLTSAIAKDVVQWIVDANMDKVKSPMLTMLLNCEGGDLSPTFSIIDMMDASAIPIRTIGTGEIASAGLMLFMNGAKGTRVLTPNTSVMSHRFSAGSDGKYHELKSMAIEFDLINDRMMNHYVKTTGKDKKTIEKTLLPPHDVFMTPQQALQFGVCDSIGLISF
jgi:ATP-dependent Clp protease protease subunit